MILDKRLSVTGLSTAAYLGEIARCNLAMGLVLLITQLQNISAVLWYGLIPGVLYALLYYSYYRALEHEQVSRIIGLIYTFPLFVALGAAFFLGERLSLVQYWASGCIVIGAVALVSHRLSLFKLKRILPWLSIVVLSESFIELIDKRLLSFAAPLPLQAAFCLALAFALFPFVWRSRKEDIKLSSSLLVWLSQGLVCAGSLCFLYAVSRTEVTKVAAVIATQPLFALLLATVFFPKSVREETDRRALVFKYLSTGRFHLCLSF